MSADGNRGWVSGSYLSYGAAGGSYVPLVEYVSEYDVPIISFSVGTYWDSYYRNRPWYGQRARWRDRWDGDRRVLRRDRREDRVERRWDRRDGRVRGDLIAGLHEWNAESIAVTIAWVVVIADGTSAPNAASIGVRERRRGV